MNENGENKRDFGSEIDKITEGMAELKEIMMQMAGAKQQKPPEEPEVDEEPEADEELEADEEPEFESNDWESYAEQMGKYGERIAEHFSKKFGGKNWGFYSSQRPPRPPRPPKPPRSPKPPKPPKTPKAYKFDLFSGTGLDGLGDKIRNALDKSLKDVEITLRDLNADIDMVDVGFKPILDSIRSRLNENGVRGVVTYTGGYKPYDGHTVYWSAKERTFDDILSSLHSIDAEKVLGAIGSRQKLDILLALLHAPMTVNELVAFLSLNSTGQAYHHLHHLLAAKVVVEEQGNKGVYAVNPSRVQGIIMILAGVRDLLNAEGGGDVKWENEKE